VAADRLTGGRPAAGDVQGGLVLARLLGRTSELAAAIAGAAPSRARPGNLTAARGPRRA
jgi:hypothetical protein